MKRCNRCVMDDTGDEYIRFDQYGICNYCSEAEQRISSELHLGIEGEQQLSAILNTIRNQSHKNKYDCIVGISGGLDSSYLLYLCYKWKLRVLAVHIDDGYDTDISKSNIKKLIKRTGYDYRVIRPDAYQYNHLLKAYMRAGVPNLDAPQDNILFASMYAYIAKNHIKYFMSGMNFATESILQKGNIHTAYDAINIKDINKRFGDAPIDKLKLMSIKQRNFISLTRGIKTIFPLNYVDYTRGKAFKELNDFCGFEYYGRKHLENKLTAFIQLYWFPKKFNVDKRTSHLSSLIISGQMTREEALKELEEPLYDEIVMSKYIDQIRNNMEMSVDEFESIMKAPTHEHLEYASELNCITYKIMDMGWERGLELYHFLRKTFRHY